MEGFEIRLAADGSQAQLLLRRHRYLRDRIHRGLRLILLNADLQYSELSPFLHCIDRHYDLVDNQILRQLSCRLRRL